MRILLRVIVFIAISGLFINQTLGQKKCKYEYEENDPFTGKISKGTSTTIFPISISTREFWHIGIERINDDFNIVNNIHLGGELSADIQQGDSLMFATKSGEVITCFAVKKVSPNTIIDKIMNETIITSGYISRYEISREQVEALADSEITNIRINIADQVYQQEIKSKHAKDFLNDANCILQ
jgi:hypothetical protein